MPQQHKFIKNNVDEWKARGFKNSLKGGDENVSQKDGYSLGNTSIRPKSTGNRKKNQAFHESICSKKLDNSNSAADKKEDGGNEITSGNSLSAINSTVKHTAVKKYDKADINESLKTMEKKTNIGSKTSTQTSENQEKILKRKKQKFQGYTLFVGNLSYETSKEDLLSHFSKCGTIKTVRLPVEKETNKPRGFAYIEVEDHVTYENILSLHHSFLKKRRINVECTFGGSKASNKRKALIKKQTLKLRFLSREGKISTTKKRSWGKFVKADEKI